MSDSESPAAPNSKDAILFDDHGKLPHSEHMPLSIDTVAKMFNISRLTLRTYECLGVIRPRGRIGESLVYSWADCGRLAFIIKARKAGLPVRQVAPLIKATETGAAVQSIKAARAKCLELIDQLDRRRQALRDALAELRLFNKLLATKLPAPEDGLARDDRHGQDTE